MSYERDINNPLAPWNKSFVTCPRCESECGSDCEVCLECDLALSEFDDWSPCIQCEETGCDVPGACMTELATDEKPFIGDTLPMLPLALIPVDEDDELPGYEDCLILRIDVEEVTPETSKHDFISEAMEYQTISLSRYSLLRPERVGVKGYRVLATARTKSKLVASVMGA